MPPTFQPFVIKEIDTLTASKTNIYKDIPRSTTYAYIDLLISGVLTVGGHNATLVEDGILNFIKRVECIFSTLGLKKRVSAEVNAFRQWMQEKTMPVINQPAVTVGANAFSMVHRIYFYAVGTGRPLDTLFNAQRESLFNLEVETGAATDIATAGLNQGDSVSVGSLVIKGVGYGYNNIPKTAAYRGNNEMIILPSISGKVLTVSPQFQDLSVLDGDAPIKSLTFRTEMSDINDSDVITDIRLSGKRNGQNVYIFPTTFRALQVDNLHQFEVMPYAQLATPPINQVGKAIMEFDVSRNLNEAEMINPADFDGGKLVLQGVVAKAGTMEVLSQYLTKPE